MNNDSSLHSLGSAQRSQCSTRMGSNGTFGGLSPQRRSCAVILSCQTLTCTWADTRSRSSRSATRRTTFYHIGNITLFVDAAQVTSRTESSATHASTLSAFIDVGTLTEIQIPCCGARAHSSEVNLTSRGFYSTSTGKGSQPQLYARRPPST